MSETGLPIAEVRRGPATAEPPVQARDYGPGEAGKFLILHDVAVDGEAFARPLRRDFERPRGEFPNVGGVLHVNEGLHRGVADEGSRYRLRFQDGSGRAVDLNAANDERAGLKDHALRRRLDRGHRLRERPLVLVEIDRNEVGGEGAGESSRIFRDRGIALMVVGSLDLRLLIGGDAGAGGQGRRGQSGQGASSHPHRGRVRARALTSPACHHSLERRVLGRMSRPFVAAAGLLLAAVLLLAPCRAATQALTGPPQLSASERGATVEDVTIKTYDVTKPSVVRRYLSVHEGSVLEQAGVDRDYDNLLRLGGYRPRVTIEPGDSPHGVKLHWIVMAKWLKPTDHPFYADQPLSAPIQGVGFIVTSQSLDSRGTNISAYTQLSRRANLARVLFTVPTHVDPVSGRDRQVIVDGFGGKGVFRASQPLAINIYSWTAGFEAVYLARGGDGTQFELAPGSSIRPPRNLPESWSGSSLYDTYYAPARNTVLEAGLSHPCLDLADQVASTLLLDAVPNRTLRRHRRLRFYIRVCGVHRRRRRLHVDRHVDVGAARQYGAHGRRAAAELLGLRDAARLSEVVLRNRRAKRDGRISNRRRARRSLRFVVFTETERAAFAAGRKPSRRRPFSGIRIRASA